MRRTAAPKSRRSMQPKRVRCPIRETAKGELRTLGISGQFDHVIAVAHVPGGDLRRLAIAVRALGCDLLSAHATLTASGRFDLSAQRRGRIYVRCCRPTRLLASVSHGQNASMARRHFDDRGPNPRRHRCVASERSDASRIACSHSIDPDRMLCQHQAIWLGWISTAELGD